MKITHKLKYEGENMRLFTVILLCIGLLVGCSSNVPEKPTSKEAVELKRQVDNAYGILEKYGEEVRLGKISVDSAQKLAKKEISEMRYNDQDYFFIFNTNLVMVMHPMKPDLEGKNLSSFRDVAGRYLFSDFRDVAIRDGGGYSTYNWPKPGDTSKPSQKLSYIKLYKPWGWIIGSGMYVKQRGIFERIYRFWSDL